jgi:hypothetical protein
MAEAHPFLSTRGTEECCADKCRGKQQPRINALDDVLGYR